ncbi:MAG: NAD-dependent epimerase/dehydratase family protein [Candidatus Acidiferrales bacterium]|jgi:UDP-glucose 4-epimerase
MKILVTGGAGFIASHVADAYAKLGHEVVVVDDLSRGSRDNVPPDRRLYVADIQDRSTIENIFVKEKPDVINHHAAQMDVRRGVREPIFDASVNILGSLNLIELAVANGVKRFIYAATAGAGYGEPKQMPVPEDYPINPITPYGVSKHTVEHYLFTFHDLYGLEYVALRYGNVYGPRQSPQGEAGVFAVFSEQMLGGVEPVIYGDGTKIRDYVYISDVAAANVAALDRGTCEIFNISSGAPTTDLDVFLEVRKCLAKPEITCRHVPKRAGEIDRICLDVTKAKRLLEWQPKVNLEEGARLTTAYFQRKAAQIKGSVVSVNP